MTKIYRAEDFEPLIGTRFLVAEGPDRIELAAVERHKAIPGLRQPFTALFQGPRSKLMKEGLYQLTAEGGTSFELYVIPVLTLQSDRQDYQCVFN